MAINLILDSIGNPEPPSIILANRNGNKLGQLDVDANSIDVKDILETSEFTFTLNKYVDGEITNLWDKVLNFKLVYCPEWDLWYEIKVELDESTETIKTVFCTQLGQAELSQIMVYNTEINTEADIARDDYKISILYDEDNKDASILHRVMSKAPHYSIAYVDESLKRIQRSFSFDDSSICDVLDEIEEEVGCLVIYNSNSDEKGMPKRDISVYDLLQNCKNPSCKHRGEFTDKCPKCGSVDIHYGYGQDTTIFVTSDELATEGIQLVTDTDSVKNCFKLEAGDDLMTATIRNCNPNGSDYIWYFSDAVKEDMSKELVESIEGYDNKYKEYYDSHISNLDNGLIDKYNALVNKYQKYYNTKSTCINCDYEGYFEKQCPSCNSTNILTGKILQTIDSSIKGYPNLMNAYYNTIDLALYLESGLMPTVEMGETDAKEQVKLLTTSSLSPVAVNVEDVKNVSLSTANSAVLSMAKVIIKPTYKVEINTSVLSDQQVWSGQFVITNYSDDTDTATSDTINVLINNQTEDFIKQKLEKALNKEDTDDLSISGLFDDDKYDYDSFCEELKKYALNPLKSFYDACDACLNILIDQGAGDKNEKPDLYENLYEPYYNKSLAIANEIKIREEEIVVIKGLYDETNENNKVLIADGLQTNIEDCKRQIQEELNFEDYLGEDLWLEFCAYRREDKYSNSNYVSDGLNNAELFERALEFVEVAENEIFKSAELQHSISATLNNLLIIPKFKPLVKSFKTGNWIRVQVDDKIYKLRLLEYDFSYGDLKNISVEFSDVTKIKNGITDLQDVVSQTASIASSYGSVQRQAKKGNVARNTIDQWLVDGLSAANVQIQNNNSEEVLMTKNGLLARSYNDITGEYSPEQLKITHNIMAYTDDNWQTVRQAIGKHDYKLYDENENSFVDESGYGMNADFVVAGVVSGSQIIGGDIYSDNYSVNDRTGSYLNLRDGTFSFGGGSLRFEKDEDGETQLVISSPNIPTTETITKINEEYLQTTSVYAENLQVNSAKIQGKLTASQIDVGSLNADDIFGTTITGKTIESSDFIGGYLIIGDESKVSDYAEINESGKLTCTNVDISGIINAGAGGTIANFTIGDTAIYNGTNSLTSAVSGIYLGIDGIRQYESEDANVTISNGILNANGAEITGNITAEGGYIGGFTIDDTKIYTGSKDSLNKTTYKGIYIGEDGISVGGVLQARPDLTTYYANVTLDASTGKLIANYAEITGKIIANSGYIGNDINGFSIGDNAIYSVLTLDGQQSYMNSPNTLIYPSLVAGSEGKTFDYVYVGTNGVGTISTKVIGDGSNEITTQTYMANGKLFSNSAEITGKIVATEGYIGNKSSGFAINNSAIRYGKTAYNDNYNGVYIGTDGIGLGQEKFYVTNEGFLYANSGNIGGWSIVDSTLTRAAQTDNVGNPTWTLADNIKLTHKSGTEYDTWLELGWTYGSQLSNGKVYPYYGFTTNSNLAFQVDSNRIGKLDGTWTCVGTWTESNSSSDMRIKNSIGDYTTEYDVFFDNIKPRRYKYNNGTSDRYHTGFIAQELVEAIESSGLTTQDFAGVMLTNPNTEDECWYLRRDEFVSLNTWQIQKLKKRISELEEKVKSL